MLDGLLTNKYFVIALIIALIVIIFLYNRKRTCTIEGMQNIGTISSKNIDEKAWEENPYGGKYKLIEKNDNKTSKKRNKYDLIDDDDEINLEFVKYRRINNPVNDRSRDSIKKRKKMSNSYQRRLPAPIDDRPDLMQCKPCICPGDSSDSSDSEFDYRKFKENRKKRHSQKRHSQKRYSQNNH